MVSGVPFNFGLPGQGTKRQGSSQALQNSGDIFGASGQVNASNAGFNGFGQGFPGEPFGFPPGGFDGPAPGGFGGRPPGGPDPQRAQAFGQLRNDLQSAGIDFRNIAQQVAASNNGQVTPQLMDQAIQSAASQVQDPTLQSKILQDVSNLQSLGPPPGGPGQGPFGPGGPGRRGRGGHHHGPHAQALQQLNTDLQSAGIDIQSIAQQVAAANNGQVTPELMNQAIKSAASQIQDPTVQAKVLQDVGNLESLGPPPPPPGFGGQNPFGTASSNQGLGQSSDISRLFAQQLFPQLNGGQSLDQYGSSPQLLLSQALQSYGQAGTGLGL
jgi:hypothetical protein